MRGGGGRTRTRVPVLGRRGYEGEGAVADPLARGGKRDGTAECRMSNRRTGEGRRGRVPVPALRDGRGYGRGRPCHLKRAPGCLFPVARACRAVAWRRRGGLARCLVTGTEPGSSEAPFLSPLLLQSRHGLRAGTPVPLEEGVSRSPRGERPTQVHHLPPCARHTRKHCRAGQRFRHPPEPSL